MRKTPCGHISLNPMRLLQEKDQGMIKVSLGMRRNTHTKKTYGIQQSSTITTTSITEFYYV